MMLSVNQNYPTDLLRTRNRTADSTGFVFAIALLVACTPCSRPALADSTKPNVLLICVDDLKPAIGCFGDQVAKTPNIDRLAARGVRFDSAYCNQAVCSPSRNALLTSLRPQTLGIYDLPTNFRKSAPDAITLGQHFRKFGYRTEALGKIFHVGHGNKDDTVSWDVPHFNAKAKQYANPTQVETRKDKNGDARGPVTESADVDDETYADGAVAAEAILRINNAAKSDQPFLIACGFIRPHLPFVAPKKYWDMYDADSLPMPTFLEAPELAPSYAATAYGEIRQYTGVPVQAPIDRELTRHLIHGYYAATSYMDTQVGRLLDALDASAAAKNTIVVLWGDHGWHLGDHGMWCKHTNYEQAARIPVIVSAPGFAQGASTRAMIESVDIYPTLAELAGLETPKSIDGISFAGVLNDPAQSARDHVIHVYPRGNRLGRAIRTPRYRMVQWKVLGETSEALEPIDYELYDYQLDPLETKNLAASQSEILSDMLAILSKHPEAKPQWKSSSENNAAAGKSTTKKKPSKDRKAMFAKRDANGDQSLTFEEFMTGQPDPEDAKKRFPKFDTNKDGALTPSEFINN